MVASFFSPPRFMQAKFRRYLLFLKSVERFRNQIITKGLALALLTGLLCGFLSHYSAQHSTSQLALWLADHLDEGAELKRNELISSGGRFVDKSTFFAWAGELVSEHPDDFSFPETASGAADPDLISHLLVSAWDARFQTSGMGSNTARIEPPKNWHFEGKNTVLVRQTVAAHVVARPLENFSTELPVQHETGTPFLSGIAIGAP